MVTIFGSLKEVIAIAKHKRFLTLEHIDRVIEVIPDQCFTLTDAHDALPVGEVGTVKVTPAYVRFYPWDVAPSQHSRFIGWEKSLMTRYPLALAFKSPVLPWFVSFDNLVGCPGDRPSKMADLLLSSSRVQLTLTI